MAEVKSNPSAVPTTVVPTTATPATQVDLEKPIMTFSRNLALRAWRHSDAEELSRQGNNRKIGQNMRAAWPDPYTVDKAHDWIARCRNEDSWVNANVGHPDTSKRKDGTNLPSSWTITMDDRCIGSIGIEPSHDILERSLSFGYWIGQEHWNQGIVTQVVQKFVPWVFETYPYVVRLAAGVYGWNPNSAKVLLKAGFEYEGALKGNVWRFDQVTDLLIYSKLREGTVVSTTMPF